MYFWLAGFYVKKRRNLVCPPPSCSDTASSTVWGALARSQGAACIAPAAAAATAAGGCLLLALLLLLRRPPPGSGGDGCCIRSCLAPHRHLACQSRGGGSEGWSASEGPAGERVGGEAPCAQPPRRCRPRRARAPGGGGGGARRLAHLAGPGPGRSRRGRAGAGRDFWGMRSSRGQVQLLPGVRASERAGGGREAGRRALRPRLLPGRWRWQE